MVEDRSVVIHLTQGEREDKSVILEERKGEREEKKGMKLKKKPGTGTDKR